jgi:hypothetical protein
MPKIIQIIKSKISRKERGQVLVMVAGAAIGIIAIIGLTIDVGLMFIGNARLRRATDAAALAAALQYREGVDPNALLTDATQSATEFMLLNGVTLDGAHPVIVHTCYDEPSLCQDANGNTISRKLVYVKVTATVQLAFLPVIGINSVPISAEATSETASLDLVLVIDTSESMTFDAKRPVDAGYDVNTSVPWDLRDPSVCNYDDKSIAAIQNDGSLPPGVQANLVNDINTDGIPGECHPFEEVKSAAMNFVNSLYFPYDRVAIVTFDKTSGFNQLGGGTEHDILHFNEDCNTTLYALPCTAAEIQSTLANAIKNLKVYEGAGVCPTGQPCRPYCLPANGNYCDSYSTTDIANFLDPTTNPLAIYAGGGGTLSNAKGYACGDSWLPGQDPSGCSTTDLGDGLLTAGDEFSVSQRQGSLWVVVLLTDGSANSGPVVNNISTVCPSSEWDISKPLCRDASSATRHCLPGANQARCIAEGNGLPVLPDNPSGIHVNGLVGIPGQSGTYDADDYARDMADFVGTDNGALIFTIGLGGLVNSPPADPAGARFLQYAAESVGNGLYFDAPGSDQLNDIFKKIGDNIATRLAR